MNDEILVSIQCLVYNHEPYLRQCLDGFVVQKTNFRFEAIVHDDVSTDGSAAIIREYAEKYPDIIKPIYETENQYSKQDGSLFKIMNAACKGKYIAMCEGDEEQIRGIVDVFSPAGHKSSISYRPDMPNSLEAHLDMSKTKKELGYEPQFSYIEAMKDLYNEMKTEPFAQLWGKGADYVKQYPNEE